MIKRLVTLTVLVASVLLTACGAVPQAQNAAAGATLGAIFGAVVGNNRHAAEAGAVLGGITGALLPVNTMSPGQVIQQRPVMYGGVNTLSPQACASGYRQINGTWQCMGGAIGVPQQFANRQPNCIRNRDGVGIFASSEQECRNFSSQ